MQTSLIDRNSQRTLNVPNTLVSQIMKTQSRNYPEPQSLLIPTPNTLQPTSDSNQSQSQQPQQSQAPVQSKTASNLPQQQQQQQTVPQTPIIYNERAILEDELKKTKYKIAELEKQILHMTPEIHTWRNRYIEMDQELEALNISQPPKIDDLKIQRDDLQKQIDDRDKDIHQLIKTNRQLQERLLQVLGLQQQKIYAKQQEDAVINQLRESLKQKENQLIISQREKGDIEQTFNMLVRENQNLKAQFQQ